MFPANRGWGGRPSVCRADPTLGEAANPGNERMNEAGIAIPHVETKCSRYDDGGSARQSALPEEIEPDQTG